MFSEEIKSTNKQKHIVFDSDDESEAEVPVSSEEGPGEKMLGKVSVLQWFMYRNCSSIPDKSLLCSLVWRE